MASIPIFSSLRTTMIAVLIMGSLTFLFLMYYKSFPSPNFLFSPAVKQTNKSVLLLWFWPEDIRFDLQVCKMFFNTDNNTDRSLHSRAQGVLIFHRAINDDLSNLPTSRTRLQRWIWFHMDSPTNTRRIAGIQGLFQFNHELQEGCRYWC